MVAYSVAVPVLPDYAARLDVSPAMLGTLFGSFGLTLLAVSIPMGIVSDRIGRRGPLVLATSLLTLSTIWFAFASSLPMLFGARLLQGVADGVTWVVGFALLADLYGHEERGRTMGLVMAAAAVGVIIGPSIGGWLYEWGGIRLPFLSVAVVAGINTIAFCFIRVEARPAEVRLPMRRVLGHRAILVCAVTAAAGSATFAMLEPVLPLLFEARFAPGPAGIGLLFGAAALGSAVLHPLYGRLSGRWGGRRLMLTGLVAAGLLLPSLNWAVDWRSSAVTFVIFTAALNLVVTPSLTFMAETSSAEGLGSFGAVYGLYNVAWGFGLMVGPAAGGLLFDTFGFPVLTMTWSAGLMATALVVRRYS
jgi:multidrug resistance protein